MVLLYILLGIVLLVGLLLSLHIKLYIKIEEETTVHAGFGPVLVQLAPKKKPRPVRLSDFTYKKHQKRLKKDQKAAEKKALKEQAKRARKKERESLKARAGHAASTIDKAAPEDKLASFTDILSLIFEELPKLASYLKTEIRLLRITVGGQDADRIARSYGKIAALLPLFIELLEAKTKLTPVKANAVQVAADFVAPKTTVQMNVRIKLRLFSLVRIAFHALLWLIRQKMKQAAQGA